MPAQTTPPPTNPDIKRELKQQLLNMSARSFEFFAGDFLVYAGLEAVSVTRYIGDGGIDALGDLVAGHFRVPIGIQVKRHRNNVQRPDIDTFIGALSGRFSEGIFMTTANYAPGALQKATTSIPQAQTAIALCKTMVLSTYINHRNNDTALSHPNKRCDLRCLFSSLMIKITKEEQHMETVRIGILGAARIVPSALIQPAQQLADVTVAGIAARDVVRGQTFAQKHTIHQVFASYDELLASPTIDAVYIPLPNSLHEHWTLKALAAGKHVLCEKPFASNTVEAERMAEAAQQSRLVLMEAFHYRYHPLATRMQEIVRSGELGTIHRIEAWVCFPLLSHNDIRYNLSLAGGAMMDAGSYTINVLRFLAGNEPEVVQATAKLASPGVDRRMDADLRFPNGITGHMRASLLSSDLLHISVRVIGERGTMSVLNFIAPHIYHRLTVHTPQGKRKEHVAGDTTYTYQLRAFIQAITQGTPVPTDPIEAIANMRVMDAVYRQAGLHPRAWVHDSI